jgi:hypothetical protein
MAYVIFVEWSCHGILTCLICVKETDCFYLSLVERCITLIAIDVFCVRIICSGSRESLLGRAQLS